MLLCEKRRLKDIVYGVGEVRGSQTDLRERQRSPDYDNEGSAESKERYLV